MKNLIFVSFIIGTLISCSSDEVFDAEQYPQKWKLIEMSGNISNVPPSTGSEMSWQEEYILFSDNTFIKSRDSENVVMEEDGTFGFVILSDGEYLELIYESESELIGSCGSKTKELLKLHSGNKLIGTWQACDGPGLVYKRIV